MSDEPDGPQSIRKGNRQERRAPVDGIVRERKPVFSLPVIVWVIAAFLISSFGTGIGLSILKSVGVSFTGSDQNVYATIVSAVIYILLLLITLGVPRIFKLWSTRLSFRKLLGLTRLLQYRDILFAVLGFVVYLALAVALVTVVSKLIPGFNVNQVQDLPFSKALTGRNAILVFLSLVVVAPIAEEIIFRGYLFGNLRRTLPTWAAALITSVVFGAIHLQWNVGLDVFMLSLVSCFLRYKTGSLWASMLLHMAKNGLAFYTLYIAASIIR